MLESMFGGMDIDIYLHTRRNMRKPTFIPLILGGGCYLQKKGVSSVIICI